MEVVLVECEGKGSNVASRSGFKFCDRFVLTVGSLILPFFDSGKRFDDIQTLSNLRFFVTKCDKRGFERVEAKISEVFQSESVKDCAHELFGEWSLDSEENSGVVREALAIFLVLRLECKSGDSRKELGVFGEGIEKFRGVVSRGRQILVESVPFGNKYFINNQSCGIISNVLGRNNCFILSDCPTVPGSEGSPMYFKNSDEAKIPIGIVLSSLSWWRGEWIGLTLCINLFALLDEINSTSGPKKILVKPTRSLSESVAQVTCGGQWGTAVLLDKDGGILLTNSHVVSKGREVELRWGEDGFPGEVLYQTGESAPCDLAVLKADAEHCRFMENARFAETPAVKGETVFAVGYSLFPRKIKAQPTLSRGIVSDVSPTMIKTTCCINPGASGGALFKPNGELLGIIVSNAKLTEKDTVSFPRVNMCIPILVVSEIISRFLEVKDVKILEELEMMDSRLWRTWTVLTSKL